MNRIKELFKKDNSKIDKVVKSMKKKRSTKLYNKEKDGDMILNSSESEYDHDKFTFNSVKTSKNKDSQPRKSSNPKISKRKMFFTTQLDKLKDHPKPSLPKFFMPVRSISTTPAIQLPKALIYNVSPRLSAFIGIKRGTQNKITSNWSE